MQAKDPTHLWSVLSVPSRKSRLSPFFFLFGNGRAGGSGRMDCPLLLGKQTVPFFFCPVPSRKNRLSPFSPPEKADCPLFSASRNVPSEKADCPLFSRVRCHCRRRTRHICGLPCPFRPGKTDCPLFPHRNGALYPISNPALSVCSSDSPKNGESPVRLPVDTAGKAAIC